jgi:hypothetical protein
MSISGSNATSKTEKELKKPKTKLPDMFQGERSKLKSFLSQVELYIGFHSDEFHVEIDRIL